MKNYRLGSLQGRIEKKKFTFKQSISIIYQVLDALEYIHDKNIIHRDIKPDNILFDTKDFVLLADFGLGKSTLPSETLPITSVNTILGTKEYQAPEVKNGEPATVVSDLYSVGITFYQMLTGKLANLSIDPNHRPASADPLLDLLCEGLRSNHKEEPVPEDFLPILRKLLEPDKDKRYKSATEVQTALDLLIDTKPRIPAAQKPVKPSHSFFKELGKYLLVILLLLGIILRMVNLTHVVPAVSCSANPPPTKDTGSYPLPSTQTGSDGEQIGLSVGTQFFEPAQTDPYHVQKLEIAKDITSGKTSLAMSELQKLTQLTSDSEKNDAEALIYQEDQRILLASLPYITVVLDITVVLGMDFSPSLIGGTHDTLQGAYTEQHLWNTTCQGQTQLLLVLANTGSNSISRDVIGQIAKLPNLVGIIGWENSTDTINAIHALGAEQIPLISPSASDTEITGKFFLRMVPSNGSTPLNGERISRSRGSQNLSQNVLGRSPS